MFDYSFVGSGDLERVFTANSVYKCWDFNCLSSYLLLIDLPDYAFSALPDYESLTHSYHTIVVRRSFYIMYFGLLNLRRH